jgi:hypothetical protein
MFALLVSGLAGAALLVLPVATYFAGRWTGRRWLAVAGLAVAGFQVLLGFAVRAAVDGAVDGGWGRGSATMGEYVGVVSSLEGLINALVIGALVLWVARAVRRSRI